MNTINEEFTWPIQLPDWDGRTEVSVIMPFCNEGSNVVFTVQALIGELQGWCNFEIILIDNCSDWYINCNVKNERMARMEGQERPYPVRSRAFFQGPPGSKNEGSIINTWFFRKGIVKYLQYDVRQGHWQAKNWGIVNSRGKYLFFLDAHCIMEPGSLKHMVKFLRNPPEEKIGGVHSYINYILDSRSLEYRPQKDKFFGYCFCSAQTEAVIENGKRIVRQRQEPYKVCVMSTCGMMSPRSVFQELGPWHPALSVYGGGESYINLKQSTCGYHHWIHPKAKTWHWADKRGYQFWHDDYVHNEQIAAYVAGGEKALQFCVEGRKSTPAVIAIAENVLKQCKPEREFIEPRQVETLDHYFDRWVANPGTWEK